MSKEQFEDFLRDKQKLSDLGVARAGEHITHFEPNKKHAEKE